MGSIWLLSRQGEVIMAMTSAGARKEALDDALENTFTASDPVSVEQLAPPQRIATDMLSIGARAAKSRQSMRDCVRAAVGVGIDAEYA